MAIDASFCLVVGGHGMGKGGKAQDFGGPLLTTTRKFGRRVLLQLSRRLPKITQRKSKRFDTRKPQPRPRALAFLKPRPGQKPTQAKNLAGPGLAFFGLAWPGFWPQAGAGKSLL